MLMSRKILKAKSLSPSASRTFYHRFRNPVSNNRNLLVLLCAMGVERGLWPPWIFEIWRSVTFLAKRLLS